MKYYESMQELIGSTPLVQLNHLISKKGIHLFGKLELYNPSGSVKDRIGQYMIADAEKNGFLKPGSTIIEATAGNTGLGIAFAALNKGYRIIFVVPTKFSIEKQQLMKAFGAEVINTPRELGMLGAVSKAEELKAQIPGSVSFEQFKNKSNPLAHYETTGPEIYDALDGNIDYVVLGAGSGGTFTGILKYLKEKNLVDEVIKVSDQEAFEMSRELTRKEGIIAGTSSGAALAAVKKLVERIDKGNVVVIFPDRGDRYFSAKLYDYKE